MQNKKIKTLTHTNWALCSQSFTQSRDGLYVSNGQGPSLGSKAKFSRPYKRQQDWVNLISEMMIF